MSEIVRKIADKLRRLLMLEYHQRDFYESHHYQLYGPSSPAIQEHLREHYDEELQHILILQRYLMELQAGGEGFIADGGLPSWKKSPSWVSSTDNYLPRARLDITNVQASQVPSLEEILSTAFELEQEAVAAYSETIGFLESLECEDVSVRPLCDRLRFSALRVDLENILVQEKGHVHDLIQWLGPRTEMPNTLDDEYRYAAARYQRNPTCPSCGMRRYY